MIDEFTAAERQFLADLATNAVWRDILAKLAHYDLPRYKPDGDDPAKQCANWQFRSGIDRGRKDVVKLLTHE